MSRRTSANDLNRDAVQAVANMDDFTSDGIGTGNAMDIGDTFFGELDYLGDWDWIAIDLTAGQTIRVDMVGDTLADPLLLMANQDGTILTYNDQRDGNFINDAQLDFTAYRDGTYYIIADTPGSSGTGTYEVSVALAPDPAAFDPVDAVLWGTQMPQTTIDVFFAPSGYTTDGVTAEGFNAYERQQIELALSRIADVSGLTFNIVTSDSSADFILLGDSNEIGVGPNAALGYFYPPSYGPNAGTGVFATNLWDRSAGGDLELGGNGFATIVHEVLHGLGLAHPHDTGGGAGEVLEGVVYHFGDFGAYDLNQGVYTTMSYNAGMTSGPVGAVTDTLNNSYGVEAGPMALDIAVLQALYGANTTHAAGDDTYAIATSNGIGLAWMAIWDTGGEDEITYAGSANAVIDLRAATLEGDFGGGGFLSGADGISGGFTIASGVLIENAASGSGDDTVTGNDGDNLLRTNGGDDIVWSGKGHDMIEAGEGADQVWAGSGNDTIYGGVGNDFLRGSTDFDTLYGGAGNDQLRGQKHNDVLYGGIGNDNLNAGGGNDVLYGEDGDDFLKGGARRDVLKGGDGNDRLFGNSFDDTLFGGAGADTLNGGGQNDRLDGGGGNDSLKGGADADTFIFDLGSGNDTIVDFDPFADCIEISAALANGKTAQQIIQAAVEGIADLTLVFDSGESVIMNAIVDRDILDGALIIV